jgi:hypothetical protein
MLHHFFLIWRWIFPGAWSVCPSVWSVCLKSKQLNCTNTYPNELKPPIIIPLITSCIQHQKDTQMQNAFKSKKHMKYTPSVKRSNAFLALYALRFIFRNRGPFLKVNYVVPQTRMPGHRLNKSPRITHRSHDVESGSGSESDSQSESESSEATSPRT